MAEFVPRMAATGTVSFQWSHGALVARSAAIILHLKRIKCPPPKPSSLGCPSGGFPESCREINVWGGVGSVEF